MTPEIAAIRGVEQGRDCVSPPGHSAFGSADELLDVVESIAQATGLPVGIKSAVGEQAFWDELAGLMARDRGRGLDFVMIDGGEGGTGAAPLAFTDHVALPFKLGFARVYASFARAGIAEEVVFVGSGKLGFPDAALFALALGCDMVNVGREAMMAIGCIQAQRCHTGHCPTGVATQSAWLTRGLDPELKAVRLATYVRALRGELLALARACGVDAPGARRPRAAGDRLRALHGRPAARGVRLRAGLGGAAAGAPRGDRGADERAGELARRRAGARPGARRRDGRGCPAGVGLAGAAAALPARLQLRPPQLALACPPPWSTRARRSPRQSAHDWRRISAISTGRCSRC